MSSTESRLTARQRQQLLDIAAHSVAHGLRQGRALVLDVTQYTADLRALGASFVTLRLKGELRGCIGSLQALHPLVIDVAENAYAAAFRDPRFAPLAAVELSELDYHISVLNPATPMQFRDQADLLRQLRPGLDGLILRSGRHQGTFLPSVWESLPTAEQFLAQLKRKAGLSEDAWPDDVQIWRYTTESFGADSHSLS